MSIGIAWAATSIALEVLNLRGLQKTAGVTVIWWSASVVSIIAFMLGMKITYRRTASAEEFAPELFWVPAFAFLWFDDLIAPGLNTIAGLPQGGVDAIKLVLLVALLVWWSILVFWFMARRLELSKREVEAYKRKHGVQPR